MKKVVNYKIKGMQQDMTPAFFQEGFSYENHNIRINTTDSRSYMSVTNERGNSEIKLIDKEGNSVLLQGTPIGKAEIDHKLVLFCAGELSYIYLIEENHSLEDNTMYCTELWKADLGFDAKYPIETEVFYESDKIQKVYWVDGKNPFRWINIINPKDPSGVRLTGEETIHIERLDQGGIFSAGVIQYAFTYFNREGLETPIFYITPQYYASLSDKGIDADSKASCSFKIGFKNLDESFDGVHIYSIFRSTLEGEAEVKHVMDVKPSEVNNSKQVFTTWSIDATLPTISIVHPSAVFIKKNNNLTSILEYPIESINPIGATGTEATLETAGIPNWPVYNTNDFYVVSKEDGISIVYKDADSLYETAYKTIEWPTKADTLYVSVNRVYTREEHLDGGYTSDMQYKMFFRNSTDVIPTSYSQLTPFEDDKTYLGESFTDFPNREKATALEVVGYALGKSTVLSEASLPITDAFDIVTTPNIGMVTTLSSIVYKSKDIDLSEYYLFCFLPDGNTKVLPLQYVNNPYLHIDNTKYNSKEGTKMCLYITNSGETFFESYNTIYNNMFIYGVLTNGNNSTPICLDNYVLYSEVNNSEDVRFFAVDDLNTVIIEDVNKVRHSVDNRFSTQGGFLSKSSNVKLTNSNTGEEQIIEAVRLFDYDSIYAVGYRYSVQPNKNVFLTTNKIVLDISGDTKPHYWAFSTNSRLIDENDINKTYTSEELIPNTTAFEKSQWVTESISQGERITTLVFDTTDADNAYNEIKESIKTNREHYYNVIDTGAIGSSIADTDLLFKETKDVIPSTITSKDNVLFLGNYRIENNYLEDKFQLRDALQKCKFEFEYIDSNIKLGKYTGVYQYEHQLKNSSRDIKVFKYLEWYRLGVQFQFKDGKWSEVLWVKDLKNTLPIRGSLKYNEETNIRKAIPVLHISSRDMFNESLSIVDYLKSLEVVSIRPVAVYPDYNIRNIVAQGILSPTVYNVANRKDNSPYVQSSWFNRPILPETVKNVAPKNYSCTGYITLFNTFNKCSITVQSRYIWRGYTIIVDPKYVGKTINHERTLCVPITILTHPAIIIAELLAFFTEELDDIKDIRKELIITGSAVAGGIFASAPGISILGALGAVNLPSLIGLAGAAAIIAGVSALVGPHANVTQCSKLVKYYSNVALDTTNEIGDYTETIHNWPRAFSRYMKLQDISGATLERLVAMPIKTDLGNTDNYVSGKHQRIRWKGNYSNFILRDTNTVNPIISVEDKGTDYSDFGDKAATLGSWIEFRHNFAIPSNDMPNAEIQNVENPNAVGAKLKLYKDSNGDLKTLKEDDWIKYNGNYYYVDSSILTFHSPELELDTSVQNLDLSTLKLRIVGVVPITSHTGDLRITTKGTTVRLQNEGQIFGSGLHFSKQYVDGSLFDTTNYKYIAGINCTGPWWLDGAVNASGSSYNLEGGQLSYAVYPWQRFGSLACDPRAQSEANSFITRKILSNIRTSYNSFYLPHYGLWEAETSKRYIDAGEVVYETSAGIADCRLFKSDEDISLSLKGQYEGAPRIVYKGNIDSAIGGINYPGDIGIPYYVDLYGNALPRQNVAGGYSIKVGSKYSATDIPGYDVTKKSKTVDTDTVTYWFDSINNIVDNMGLESETKDPIRIKYKSTPHAVIPLNYIDRHTQNTLPIGFDFKDYDVSVEAVNNAVIDLFGDIKTYKEEKTTTEDGSDVTFTTETYIKPIQNISAGGPGGENTFDLAVKAAIYQSISEDELKDLQLMSTIKLDRIVKLIDNEGNTNGVWNISYKDVADKILESEILTIRCSDRVPSYKYLTFINKNNYKTYYYYAIPSSPDYGTLKSNSKTSLANNFKLGEGYTPWWDEELDNYQNNYVALPPSNPDYSDFYSLGTIKYSWVWLAELYKENYTDDSPFKSPTEELLFSEVWNIAGSSKTLTNKIDLSWEEGDTFYQRYDCLKTFPFTSEDDNSIIDVLSFMVETRVNIDGRYDNNRGDSNLLYLRKDNTNQVNDVYSQSNNFFTASTINSDYTQSNYFPNSFMWSLPKVAGSMLDNWTKTIVTNTSDLDGSMGKLNRLLNFKDAVLAFQDKGLSQILYNENVQISTENSVPIELANSNRVQGYRKIDDTIGCTNKWSICKFESGVTFIDNSNRGIFLYNGKLQNLSDTLGMSSWVSDNIRPWTPESFNNIITYYDSTTKDVYYIGKDRALAYNSILQSFTSFYDYGNTPVLSKLENSTITIHKDSNGTWKLWKQNAGSYSNYFGENKPFSVTYVINPDVDYDKIFTNVEFRSNTTDTDGSDVYNESIDYIEAWNEYQHGDFDLKHRDLGSSHLKRKFRIWNVDIPRNNLKGTPNAIGRISSTTDRMRNPWIYLKLARNNNPDHYKIDLYDINIQYHL